MDAGLAAAAISDIERSIALRAAHEAQAELERRHAASETLVETAAVLAATRKMEQAGQVIVERLCGLLCADAALLCGADGTALRAIAVAGDTGARLRPGVV